MARKAKLNWTQPTDTKTETWKCEHKTVTATIVKKGEEYLYNVTNSDKVIASGVTRSIVTAKGNAELRVRSALQEDCSS